MHKQKLNYSVTGRVTVLNATTLSCRSAAPVHYLHLGALERQQPHVVARHPHPVPVRHGNDNPRALHLCLTPPPRRHRSRTARKRALLAKAAVISRRWRPWWPPPSHRTRRARTPRRRSRCVWRNRACPRRRCPPVELLVTSI